MIVVIARGGERASNPLLPVQRKGEPLTAETQVPWSVTGPSIVLLPFEQVIVGERPSPFSIRRLRHTLPVLRKDKVAPVSTVSWLVGLPIEVVAPSKLSVPCCRSMLPKAGSTLTVTSEI